MDFRQDTETFSILSCSTRNASPRDLCIMTLNPGKNCCKFCSSDNWLRKRNWSWLCCVILPLQSIREAKHPDVYSFQDGAKSRTRYRERFALALGIQGHPWQSVII